MEQPALRDATDPRPRRCLVVVPVFNEVRCAGGVIARIQSAAARVPGCAFDIVCVDDGSTDGSGALLDEVAGVEVIHHAERQGYGASLSDAIARSTHEWVFIVDADNTYPVEDLGRFIEAAADGSQMVVGNRRGVGMIRSPMRNLARWILRQMVWALTGVRVDDLNSGMRLFRRALFVEFRGMLPRGFSFTTTMTVSSLLRRYRVRYLDIDYGPRVGESNIRPLRDFLGFALLIVRIAARLEPLRLLLPLATVAALVALGVIAAVRGA